MWESRAYYIIIGTIGNMGLLAEKGSNQHQIITHGSGNLPWEPSSYLVSLVLVKILRDLSAYARVYDFFKG